MAYYISNHTIYYVNAELSTDNLSAAKRFKYTDAERLIHEDPAKFTGWCIRRAYSSTSKKNYIITTARQFLNKDFTGTTGNLCNAATFKSVADAENYIKNNYVVKYLGENPSIINEMYCSIPVNIKKFTQEQLDTIGVEDRESRIKVDPVIRRQIYNLAEGKCQICGKPLKYESFTIDHIIPISRGGKNEPGNYRCACEKCNTYKADRLDDEMYAGITNIIDVKMRNSFDEDIMNRLVRSFVRGIISRDLGDNSGSMSYA